MNLIEAVNSRKPYKRVIERTWRQPHHAQVFAPEDITATDYEVEGAVPAYSVSESELSHVFSLGFQADTPGYKRFIANVISRGRVV